MQKKLNDKEKLIIIESLKSEIEKGIKERASMSDKEIEERLRNQRPPTIYFEDEFNEIDKAWITEIFSHHGLKVKFKY